MLMKRFSLAMAAAMLAGGVALAQPKSTTSGATPATPSASAPASGAASRPVKPPAAASGTVPVGTKINLNTATAAELDSLPEIGAARAKVIVSERAKGNFKDWSDFDSRMAHTSVNKGVRSKIKDHVMF
jgi:DNA uptake protein ComE-like DNA-binding protein